MFLQEHYVGFKIAGPPFGGGEMFLQEHFGGFASISLSDERMFLQEHFAVLHSRRSAECSSRNRYAEMFLQEHFDGMNHAP